MKDRKLMKNLLKSFGIFVVAVALIGGPAFAAGLAKNSVRSKHIKDGQVKSVDIGDGQVGSAQVAGNSLAAVDLAAGSVGPSELQSDAVTDGHIRDAAVTTDKLANGSVKPAKLGSTLLVPGTVSVPAGSSATATAACPSGAKILSVSSEWDGAPSPNLLIHEQRLGYTTSFGLRIPTNEGHVIGFNFGTSAVTLTAMALCLLA